MKRSAAMPAAVAPVAQAGRSTRRSIFFLTASLLLPLAGLAQSTAPVKGVTIVLPPRVVAGHPATLAVLGVDGRLAPKLAVEMGANLHVTTDRTGRALFVVPASGAALIARASGA